METTKTKKSNKEEQRQDIVQFLQEKKARDGKLNKLGEWLLENGGKSEWRVDDKDLKYVLR